MRSPQPVSPPQLPDSLIDYARTPHVGVVREDEPGPGGTTRAGVRNWEPPRTSRMAWRSWRATRSKLVAAVDSGHILDADGRVKPEWRQRLGEYLTQVSAEMVRRKATALILGCTHFEYFERDFAQTAADPVSPQRHHQPIGSAGLPAARCLRRVPGRESGAPHRDGESRSYFAFSGDRPPDETFKSLGLARIVIAKRL